jgi:hypothetical protein
LKVDVRCCLVEEVIAEILDLLSPAPECRLGHPHRPTAIPDADLNDAELLPAERFGNALDHFLYLRITVLAHRRFLL